MSKRLTDSMGQSFIADNRPGASGIIGTDAVANAPPDGYTLLGSSSTIPVARAVCHRPRPVNDRRGYTAFFARSAAIAWSS